MAKATSEKKIVSFVKGLFTEASALTFPENASLDEDNFDLLLDGSRIRRLGIDYETGYSLVPTGLSDSILSGTHKSFHKWDFPGGSTTVSIGVVRAYNKLWFVNLLASSPSASLLNGGLPITISGLANSEIEVSVITNYFIIVSEELEWPILLTYNKDTDTVSQEVFPIQVRDFWGVDDGEAINSRPTVYPIQGKHLYNLVNQGWSPAITNKVAGFVPYTNNTRVFKTVSGAWEFITGPRDGQTTVYDPLGWQYPSIEYTKLTIGAYPSNADVWTLGKVGSSTSTDFEKYDPEALKRNSLDNLEAPKGSHVIDAFKRGYSRYLLTGAELVSDQEQSTLTTITSYAGRIFYSGIISNISGSDLRSPNYSGYIFFSQTITGKDKLGKCYQEADPTSADISDIVDTDGGTIQIPEASRIIKLVSVKDSLIVFAENGVWEIYGTTGGFTATTYQIAKISTTGITNGFSVVVAGSSVVYWAKSGIYSISPNQNTGRYESSSLSLTTIQTLYNSIPDLSKNSCRGFYDEKENHIRWLYNDTVTYAEGINANHYNKILNLDLALQAFYPFTIEPLLTDSPWVSDFIDIPAHVTSITSENVVVGADLVLAGTIQVTVPFTGITARTSKYSFLTFVGTSFTISKFSNLNFYDWFTADGVGVNFDSYLITGYDTFGEIMRAKQTPYIFFYLNRTEDGFALSGTDLVATRQSSCLVQARWNWSNSGAQGKWGTAFQAYRYTRNYYPSGIGDTFDTGDSIIVTKNKVRGSGKALSLKIYSEAGKDLQLLGWAYIISGDGTP